jgi:hypothetical protein
MPDEKVFDKADLLKYYDGNVTKGVLCGRYQTRRIEGALPPRTYFDKHEVYATTEVHFCEKYHWLIISQHVYVSGGTAHLPADHFYRSSESVPYLQIIPGFFNSADILKRVDAEVKAWAETISDHLPSDYPDEPRAPTAQEIVDGVRAEYAMRGATIDTNGVIHVDTLKAEPEPA